MQSKESPVAEIECSVVSRLMWRLMPFLFLLYIVAYLDRINVGFAILQMRGQLHLSEQVYGSAAGVFFLGYILFQLPSNLGLHKFGVRRWICGLMVMWGLISCSMIFIRGPRSFYTFRFLLGAAEAGFFPGMILYMRQWFPASARARAVGCFMAANAVAGMVGSPISGALLGLHGAGLEGWQWLFLLEGSPAILLGVTTLWALADKPNDAKWLLDDQRIWLIDELERERAQNSLSTGPSFSVRDGTVARIGMLSLVYFALPTCMYGVTFWLPSAIRGVSRLSYSSTGFVAVIPYLLSAVAMVAVGISSDRSGERRWHVAMSGVISAAALTAAANAKSPFVMIAGMSLGMIGAQSMAGPFWAMATSKMSGSAAAISIAIINSLGNLGGYFGPYIIGATHSSNGSFHGGLLAIAATMVISSCLALVVDTRGSNRVVRRDR